MKTILLAFILLCPGLVFAQRINVIELTTSAKFHRSIVLQVSKANKRLATLPRKPHLTIVRKMPDPYPVVGISWGTFPMKFSLIYQWAQARNLFNYRRHTLFISESFGGWIGGMGAICGVMGLVEVSPDNIPISELIITHETGHLLGAIDRDRDGGYMDRVVGNLEPPPTKFSRTSLKEIARCKL